MKCSTDPGTTHYHGCECWEASRNERIRELEAERDKWKRSADRDRIAWRELDDAQELLKAERDTAVHGYKITQAGYLGLGKKLTAMTAERDAYKAALVQINGELKHLCVSSGMASAESCDCWRCALFERSTSSRWGLLR